MDFKFLEEIKDPFGLYIHIPFCRQKCSYCDFYSKPLVDNGLNEYIEALKKEIILYSKRINSRIKTIFFGGGTPSLLKVEELNQILSVIKDSFKLKSNIEISLEANPESLTLEKILGYKDAGINRLSLGIQSFQNKELDLLGRLHSGREAEEMVSQVNKVFENFNFDLIFAIPGQSLKRWKKDLKKALEINPPHLSLYNLQIEEGTVLKDKVDSGQISPVADSLDAEMYKYACNLLSNSGYKQYEISNFAKKGHQSQHNLIYWRYEPYIGLGPAAHSFTEKTRFHNSASVVDYIQKLRRDKLPIKENNKLSLKEQMAENIFMGLRLNEGISYCGFSARFGKDLSAIYGTKIEGLIKKGLLQRENERISLTKKGRLFGNRVFVEFI